MSNYIERYKDITDKFLFLVLVVLGALIIWLGRSFTINIVYIYSIVISIMILYGFYCFNSEYFKIRSDKAGDNIYYMGFIFTLVSLGVSLYSSANGSDQTEMIISNFGVAIITTILGVTGRVFFLQIRDTPFEIENDSLYGLNNSAKKLKVTLDDTVRDFSVFRTTLNQSINELHTEFEYDCREHLSDIKILHRKSLDNLDIATTEVVGKYEKISHSLELTNERINAIDIPKDAFVNKLVEPIDDFRFILNKTVEAVTSRVEKIDELEATLINFAKTETDFAGLIENLTQFSNDQISLGKQTTVDMVNYQDSFKQMIDVASTDFEESHKSAIESLRSLDDVFSDISHNIKRESDNINKNYNEISSQSMKVNSDLSETLSAQNELLDRTLLKDIDKYTASIRNKISDIDSVSSSFNSIISSEKELVALLDSISSKSDVSINGMQLITKRFQEEITELRKDLNNNNANQATKFDKLLKIAETHHLNNSKNNIAEFKTTEPIAVNTQPDLHNVQKPAPQASVTDIQTDRHTEKRSRFFRFKN